MQSFITSFPFILTRSHSKCQMVNQKSFIIHNLLWILKYLYTNEHILRYNSVLDWCPMETHEQAILVGNRLFWFFVLCWAVLELLNNTRNGRLSISIWLIDVLFAGYTNISTNGLGSLLLMPPIQILANRYNQVDTFTRFTSITEIINNWQ